jgi:beta-glucosidase
MECLLSTQCSADGRKGLKGTFWNNTGMEGKAVTVQRYLNPVAVTTAGMHNFAPNVNLTDFSARYETNFIPVEAGEYVVNVAGTGHFEVYVDGERKQIQHTWRNAKTRTVINATAGKTYHIEVRFLFVPTWGADLSINVAREQPIDYEAAVTQLRGYDTVVFVGGISPTLEGEEMPVNIEGFRGGDRTSIELPRVQRDFLKALKAAGKTVVFVCCSGSAIALEPETQSCDAIVQAWYAGQEGGTAVADVLFGDVNPSGKLPVTFYRSDSQLPDYEDYSMKGRTYRYFSDPLFAFGYGMSYTQFQLGEATLSATTLDTDDETNPHTLTLTVPVTNTGRRDGTEVVQVYVRRTDDTDGPLRSLRAFQRIDVPKGKTVNASLTLDEKAFELFDSETNTMHAKAGQYELYYGTSSRPEDLKVLTVTVE